MKKLLITHVDLDGISPIILLKLAKVDFEYKTVEIRELNDTINKLMESDLSNFDKIYITDLSLTEEMYEKLISLNKDILVFDHHETHLFANKYKFVTVKVDLFDRQTCGTELFYEYLKEIYPSLNKLNIQTYVDYVREIDTYNFTSDVPKEIDMLYTTYGKVDFIKTIVRRLNKDSAFTLTSFEKRFIKLKNKETLRYIQDKESEMKIYIIDNKKCGVIFAEQNKSIIGNYISQKYSNLDLVILIDASNRISYRTSRDDVSVSQFATNFGGGGHQKASGSAFSNDDRLAILKYYFKDVKELDNI